MVQDLMTALYIYIVSGTVTLRTLDKTMVHVQWGGQGGRLCPFCSCSDHLSALVKGFDMVRLLPNNIIFYLNGTKNTAKCKQSDSKECTLLYFISFRGLLWHRHSCSFIKYVHTVHASHTPNLPAVLYNIIAIINSISSCDV